MKFESSLAESVFRSKYLLEGETEPEQAVERLVKEFCRNFPEMENEAREYIDKQWYIPAGGIWRASGNPDKNVSHINCTTITPVEDNLESIFDSLYKWAKYAAYGQGEGIDISNLRPKNALVHNSSRSSTGAVSFMNLYDGVLKVIAQHGRRGASLISIKDTHPDILDFIKVKDKPESDKSRIDTANISIQVSDEFMNCVIEDKEWTLRFENKYQVIEDKIRARDLFEEICKMAHKRGDPGLQFIDKMKRESNSDSFGDKYKIVSTNACFTGDTMIAVADGRNAITIEQFANESKGTIKIPVYSGKKKLSRTNLSSHRVEIQNAVAFCSGEKEVIEVKLSDGSSFTCTPDHKICTFDGRWIEAQYSKNEQLEKFYTFMNNNEFNRSHRMVNTQTNRSTSQFRMIYEFYSGQKHNGILNVLHHKDHNPKNDNYLNLEVLSKKEHDSYHALSKFGFQNPIHKANKEFTIWNMRRRNILANAKRYAWSEERKQNELNKFLSENPKPEVPFIDSNVYYNYPVYVVDITFTGKIEKVYDLTVENNHSFYIITKTENDNYYNCSGILVHNCSEQALDPENVCNLGHINLAKFNEFSLEGYYKLIRFGMYFGVSIIKNELADGRSPTKLQKEKLINMPRVGLGLTGLADYFIDNKIVYGSIASIDKVHQIFSDLARYSYKANCELGKKFGSFPSYDINKMKKSKFIQRLLENNLITDNDLTHQYCIACNTIAPVGSGSLIANVGGSGIEPIFSKYYVRRERSTTNEWKEWFTFNAYVERYLKEHNLEVTKENADKLVDDYWSMSYDVDNLQKIKLVAEAQRWIDSSISVTFNITEDATVEDVKQIYLEAWKNGLKGVTVYREGSLTGVLINEKNYEKSKKELESKAKEKFKGNDYVKRPDELACDIYEAKYKDDKFIVLVGINNGIPYEVFVTPNNNNEVDVEKYKTGVIKKIKSNHYDLIVQNGVHKTMVNNIGKTFDSLYGTVSRMVSMSLRHGVELPFIIDQLNKDSGFVAFEKVLSRILKKYIIDGTIASKKDKCPVCNESLVFIGGCKSCPKGCWSKCD